MVLGTLGFASRFLRQLFFGWFSIVRQRGIVRGEKTFNVTDMYISFFFCPYLSPYIQQVTLFELFYFFKFKINDKSQTKIEHNFKGFWSINSNVTITYQTALHRISCDDSTSSVHKHVRVCVRK